MTDIVKKIVELYIPKAAGERKFFDLHAVKKIDNDPKTNKETTFVATNIARDTSIKANKRKSGDYDKDGEDTSISEEELQELKKSTVVSYLKKNSAQLRDIENKNRSFPGAINATGKDTTSPADKATLRKRDRGLEKGVNRIIGAGGRDKYVTEEDIDEALATPEQLNRKEFRTVRHMSRTDSEHRAAISREANKRKPKPIEEGATGPYRFKVVGCPNREKCKLNHAANVHGSDGKDHPGKMIMKANGMPGLPKAGQEAKYKTKQISESVESETKAALSDVDAKLKHHLGMTRVHDRLTDKNHREPYKAHKDAYWNYAEAQHQYRVGNHKEGSKYHKQGDIAGATANKASAAINESVDIVVNDQPKTFAQLVSEIESKFGDDNEEIVSLTYDLPILEQIEANIDLAPEFDVVFINGDVVTLTTEEAQSILDNAESLDTEALCESLESFQLVTKKE
jgi:hypothetical protein